MYQLGNLMGILTTLLFGLALMNFVIKWGNRKWIAKLPKESKFKQGYTSVMKFLVKNHRFFGLGAAALLIAHIALQLAFKWVSVTGIVAAVLAMAAGALGGALFRSKRRSPALLWAHRGAAIALILAIAAHVITRI